MKKIIAFILSVVMLFSLCACGDSGKKLTKAEIVSALQDCDGTVETNGKEDNVKSFTFTMNDVNAENLSERDFLYGAIIQVSVDASGANSRQLKSALTIGPVISIYFLIADEGDQTTIKDLIEMTVDIISNGKTIERNGWKLSATIDQQNDSVIFNVKK